MRTTIDRAGRVVVPRLIREHLRLLGGGEVDIIERGGIIEIVPVPADVELVETQDGPVAMATTQLPPLTDEDVQTTLDESRR